jgi:paraquat-inducible protein A
MAGAATASRLGLVSCHACTFVCKDVTGADLTTCCPRCGRHLHRRIPNSIARTWALVIAAAILYIPANLLPIMETSSLFDQVDTIMTG